MPSCSDNDDTIYDDNSSNTGTEKVFLSIGGLASSLDIESNKLRLVGDPNNDDESEIYSYEVLIFKPDGTLDGYTSRTRQVRTISSTENVSYDKAYVVRDTIANIECTAGTRDIFVVANSFDNRFNSLVGITKQQFLSYLEGLDSQGQGTTSNPNAHPTGTTFTSSSGGIGIGGYVPSDLKTNLTMVGCALNVKFDPTESNHYIGFYENNGYPQTVTTGGILVSANYKFKLYRLASRIAMKSIKLDFPATLPLEDGVNANISNYEAYIDTVFLINAKGASYYSDSLMTKVPNGDFSHGNEYGYNILKNKGLSFLSSSTKYKEYLFESTGGVKNYNIEQNQSLLWFYTFENYNVAAPTQLVSNPTAIVIGVRFDFISSDGNPKTVTHYYPIQVNSKAQVGVDHLGIKRNHQYRLSVTIKNLNNGYYNYDPSQVEAIRSSAVSENSSIVEVEEEVGTHLFPWTGGVYKDYTK